MIEAKRGPKRRRESSVFSQSIATEFSPAIGNFSYFTHKSHAQTAKLKQHIYWNRLDLSCTNKVVK